MFYLLRDDITLACHCVTLTSSSPLVAHKRSCLDRPRSIFIIPGPRGGWAQPQSSHSSAGRPQHARGGRARLSDRGTRDHAITPSAREPSDRSGGGTVTDRNECTARQTLSRRGAASHPDFEVHSESCQLYILKL